MSAAEFGVQCERAEHGKAAGYLRNERMADKEALLGLSNGESSGTKHPIDLAKGEEPSVHVRRAASAHI